MHGEAGATLELARDAPHLDCARGVLSLLIERKPDHQRARLVPLGAPHQLRHGRPLPGAPGDEARRRRHGPRLIAHREPDALVAVVDGEDATGRGKRDAGNGKRRVGIGHGANGGLHLGRVSWPDAI